MEYFLVFIVLWVSMLFYFKLAIRFNIIDKPNARSSHSVPTTRGGGVIFVLAILLFVLLNHFSFPYLLLAVLVSGIVSFMDDIHTVNNKVKIGIHVVSVLLVFKECSLFSIISLPVLLLIFILVTGIINAYNFMDGINGITGLYSLSVLIPLLLTEKMDLLFSLELCLLIALLIFNFYNTRSKAVCFAGDVGSISLAIILIFLLITRIKNTGDYNYIAFLMIYGIDSVYTILQRLYFRDNIFLPHREHLYQYLSNQKGYPHVLVSLSFAMLQLLISLCIAFDILQQKWVIIIFIMLSLIYWYIKFPLVKARHRQIEHP